MLNRGKVRGLIFVVGYGFQSQSTTYLLRPVAKRIFIPTLILKMSLYRIRKFLAACIFTTVAPSIFVCGWQDFWRACNVQRDPHRVAVRDLDVNAPPKNFFVKMTDFEVVRTSSSEAAENRVGPLCVPLKAKGSDNHVILFFRSTSGHDGVKQWLNWQTSVRGVLHPHAIPEGPMRRMREQFPHIDLGNCLIYESANAKGIRSDAQFTAGISIVCVAAAAFCWYIALTNRRAWV